MGVKKKISPATLETSGSQNSTAASTTVTAMPAQALVSGTALIWDPVNPSSADITHYVLYWATEVVENWNVNIHLGERFFQVPRCPAGYDPFTSCGHEGGPLRVSLPAGIE